MDHVNDYKPPKDDDRFDDDTKRLHAEGCAPKAQLPVEQIKKERTDGGEIVGGVRLPARLPIGKAEIKSEKDVKKEKKSHKEKKAKKEKKSKKAKKVKKSKKKKSKHASSSSDSSSDSEDSETERKRKKTH